MSSESIAQEPQVEETIDLIALKAVAPHLYGLFIQLIAQRPELFGELDQTAAHINISIEIEGQTFDTMALLEALQTTTDQRPDDDPKTIPVALRPHVEFGPDGGVVAFKTGVHYFVADDPEKAHSPHSIAGSIRNLYSETHTMLPSKAHLVDVLAGAVEDFARRRVAQLTRGLMNRLKSVAETLTEVGSLFEDTELMGVVPESGLKQAISRAVPRLLLDAVDTELTGELVHLESDLRNSGMVSLGDFFRVVPPEELKPQTELSSDENVGASNHASESAEETRRRLLRAITGG